MGAATLDFGEQHDHWHAPSLTGRAALVMLPFTGFRVLGVVIVRSFSSPTCQSLRALLRGQRRVACPLRLFDFELPACRRCALQSEPHRLGIDAEDGFKYDRDDGERTTK